MSRALAIKLADLAALRIEGLPTTRQGMVAFAKRQNWRISGTARGGAYLYEVTGEIAEAISAARADLRAARRLPKAGNDQLRPVGRPRGSDYWSLNPDIADAVYLIRATYPDPAREVLRKLASQIPDYPLPHIKTVSRYIARLEREKKAELTLLRDPDSYNGAVRLAIGRADGGYSYAHQGWEVDTTPTDVTLIDDDGKQKRFAILGVIDVWSRRALFVLAESESAKSVRALIKRAISEWNAVPQRIRTDRGSGYINKSISSACEMMGIDLKACQPGDPRAKGFIERIFGTFTREMSPLLPGFVGHNVAQAQKIRAVNKKKTGSFEVRATLTRGQFQDILDNWVRGNYDIRQHSVTRQAPAIRMLQSPVSVAAAPSFDDLKIYFSAALGTKIVTKRGIIWKQQRYMDDALLSWIGRPVHVRYDEVDLGTLFVFDEHGAPICTAINYQRAGISERDFAMQKRRAQQKWEKSVKAETRRIAAGFKIEDANAAMLRDNAEAAGKLAYLHVAARPAPPPVAAAPEPLTLPRVDNVRSLPVPPKPVDIAEKAQRAERLIKADAEGFAIDAAQLTWARNFVAGAAYRAFAAARNAGPPDNIQSLKRR